MCLLDTTDGALMMALYTSTAVAKDQIAVLYYSIVLTVITVLVAIVIGMIQLLSLVLNVAEPTGRFWVCSLVRKESHSTNPVRMVSMLLVSIMTLSEGLSAAHSLFSAC